MARAQVVSRMMELRERAERLNDATDAANTLLSNVECQLIDANIGIEAWLVDALTATDETGSIAGETKQVIERLGFAKIGGSWCLATKKVQVVSGFFEGDTSCPYRNEFLVAEPAPLRKTSRDARIRALELLPKLLEYLTARADENLRTIALAQDMLE